MNIDGYIKMWGNEIYKKELIFFQDSDDIPCAGRFEKMTGYINKNGSQLCGSHELRLDYFDKTVRAHRFPIDVMAALHLSHLKL